MSLQFTKSTSLPAIQVAKIWSELVCYWPLLRNNNMATNLRRCTCTSSHRR